MDVLCFKTHHEKCTYEKILTGITCLKTSFCFVSPVEEDAAGSKSGIFTPVSE